MTNHKTTLIIAITVLLLTCIAAESARAHTWAEHAGVSRNTVRYCKLHSTGQDRAACIIRVIWTPAEGGATARKAVRVARCESTLNTRATNGIYWGLFQVSDDWRRDIRGFSWNSEAQARHALKVFRAVRHDWTPTWSCG